jgi:hypothetical protein
MAGGGRKYLDKQAALNILASFGFNRTLIIIGPAE